MLLRISILAPWSILIACALLGELPASAKAAPELPRPIQGLTVLPPAFLRGYDPITVFFPEPKGPPRGGPEDHPATVLTIEPPPAGEYRWLDERTLIFKPAAPWPPLARFKVSAPGQTKTLVTLMIPPRATVPVDGSTNEEPFDEISLTFAEPVDPADLARMVSFELRPLPGIDRTPSRGLTVEDFRIKPLERRARSDPATYVFQLKRPVGDGMTVLTHIRLSLDDTSPESIATYTFSTKAVFRVLSAGCYSDANPREGSPPASEEGNAQGESSDEGQSPEAAEESAPAQAEPIEDETATRLGAWSPRRSLANFAGMLPLTISGSHYTREQAVRGERGIPRVGLLFSADLAPLTLSQVRTLIRFSPSIPDLTFLQSGPCLCLSGRIERDTVYQAIIGPAPIKDKQGRPLRMDGPSEIFFYFPGQPSYLRWGQSQGIIERFGPQVFPMSARRDRRVDLRIHKVDPLDRSFWPFPVHPVEVDESTRPPGPGEEPPSANALSSELSTDDLKVRLLMLGSPPVSVITEIPVRTEGGATEFGLPLKDHLAKLAGVDEPGTYLVGVRRLSDETHRSYVRLQVTDLCLTTVEEPRAVQFLVTSLSTGRPVPAATITLEGLVESAAEGPFQTIASGSTDTRGMFRLEHRARLPGALRRIVVRKEADTLVLSPTDPPHAFADNHWHLSHKSWLAWLAYDPAPPPAVSSLLCAHLFTERPVYRPEEEVHIKGYLRIRDGGRLKLPPAEKYELMVSGPGQKSWTYPVEMTAQGTFYHRFQEKNLPTGDYSAQIKGVESGTGHGRVDWKMEAYTIPRFEVELHGPDRVPLDRPFTITAAARYYAGGRVVGQAIRWRVLQFPYVYSPPESQGFAFSSDERFSKAGRFTTPATIVKNDATDESGAAKLTVNPALELDARPRRYVFEATVTGADEQTVTNTRQVIALPPFVLGTRVERFQTGVTKISPQIVALDVEGKPLAGQELTVRLLQRQWHSTLTETDFSTHKPKYLTDVVDQELMTTKVTTKDRPITVELPTQTAGIYLVEVSARDKVGRLQTVTVDLYVGGTEALAWKKPEASVFETVPDKALYEPGDIARILLKSPYQTAQALAVVEGPDGNVYQELSVVGGKAVFELPIKNEYHPRIPVHFLLMRGRISASIVRGADLGKPGSMAATSWLKVDPKENKLNVKLSCPEKVLPGREVSITIRLSTPGDHPSAGEVTLWLVDQAVLALGTEKDLDPLPSFIKDVTSRLAMRDTRNAIIGDVVTEESPGGAGTEEPGLLGRVTPRKLFKTVPYFNPRILVDKTGVATVTLRLSDDLTNFMVRAVAAATPDRFGFAKSMIAVRLPVIVQPVLPRFVRVWDRFAAGGIGRVVEGDGGKGRFAIKTRGASVSGPTSGDVALLRDRPLKLTFPVTVSAPPAGAAGHGRSQLELTLAIERAADGARDAFEVNLPILPDREPVRVEVLKKLVAGRPVSFPEFDRNVRPGSVRQEALMTDREAILKLLAAMDYLYEYRYECTEQLVSQCIPAVTLRSLLDTFKLSPPEDRTSALFARTVEYLGKTLQPNGLYAFWPGCAGQVSLTAYVVQFLVDAKAQHCVFPARLLEKPLAALREALRSDYAGFVDGGASTERCEALLALTKAGVVDEGYETELAKQSPYLDPYGRSEVILAYAAARRDAGDVTKMLRNDLWQDVVFKLRDGREAYGGLQSRVAVPGGLMLSSEIKTLATMIRALYPEDRQSPRMKLLVDELVQCGAPDGWGDTSTDAAALLALGEIVSAPRALATPAQFEITCGSAKQNVILDNTHPTAHFETGSPEPAQITWTSGAGEDYWARLTATCLPAATGDTVPAHSDGFVVRHELIRVSADDAPRVRTWIETPGQTFSFRQGDVVEEHVQVINPADRHFVAVVVPLAAGMEPLNPRLSTAPPEARPSMPFTREPSYSAYLDDEVRFFYQTLPAGTFDFAFRTRATIAGSFVQPGAHAEMMYRSATRGNAAGARYVVQGREGL